MAFRVTVPAAEVVTTADPVIAQYMRVIDSAETDVIDEMLRTARELCEQFTWRALGTQTITLAMGSFPSPGLETASANWYGPSWGVGPGPLTTIKPDGQTLYEIWLPRSPCQSVTSIQYYDTSGVLQTLAPSAYLLDNYSEPACITPVPNTTWPATQNQRNAVLVTFVAGYGASQSAVPAGLLNWIRRTALTLYENRELVAILQRGKVEMLPFVNGLLVNHAVKTYNPPAYWA